MKTILYKLMDFTLFWFILAGYEWAENVTRFIVWITFIMVLLVYFAVQGDKAEEYVRGPLSSKSWWMHHRIIGLYAGSLYAVCLASIGWFFYATLEFCSVMLFNWTLLEINRFIKIAEDK